MAETPSPNSLLKDTREAKGMTLELVHEATKIPLDALKAIEQGYSVRSLTPFYYRGFIKIYAEFLGLETSMVLKAYKLEKKLSPEVRPAASTSTPAKVSGGTKKNNVLKNRQTGPSKNIPAVNPLLEQGQEILVGFTKPKNRNMVIKFGIGIIVLFVLMKMTSGVINHFKNLPKSKPKVKVTAPKMKVVKVEKPKTIKIEPRPEPQVIREIPVPIVIESLLSTENTNRKVELVARASHDAWIQVKTDGKVVFAMTMQKGTMESWSADKEIELSGKNINLLEIEVNGKHIGQLGTVERRAKRVLITKEGLSVKK